MNIQMYFRAITLFFFFLMPLLLNKLHEVNYIFKQYIYIYIYIYREREREREMSSSYTQYKFKQCYTTQYFLIECEF